MVSDFLQKIMEITTVIGCKNNCSYCPQKLLIENYSKISNKKIFSLEDYKICLSKIPKDVRIDFGGMAEPFLNPFCIDMILHTFSQGYNTTLFTTLIGLTKENYIKLKDLPFQDFAVHLPDNDNKTKILVDGKYLDLLQFILENKPQNLRFAYFNNIEINVFTIIKEYKPKTIKLNIISRGGNLKDIYNYKERKGIYYCRNSKFLQKNILLPSGDVILCQSDYGLKHILGNLLTGDYDSLFNYEYKDIIKYFKDSGKGSLCETCEFCIKKYSIQNFKIKIINLLKRIKNG
jgi:sulfatase maturation enzyme AslB (radical SAM superfamily)